MREKNKLLKVSFLFALLIISSGIALLVWEMCKTDSNAAGDIRVDVNAIEHLLDNGEIGKAKEVLGEIEAKQGSSIAFAVILLTSLSLLYILIVFSYIYRNILKPFERMHVFAANVASGDLTGELKQERGLYFGEFTWAFDSMRNEIRKARNAEQESIENNKTVIATLSHDIKTPISAIRTYSEALEANLDKTPEKRAHYLETIINKCDEVARLTEDLFLHSVSELDRISVNTESFDLKKFMNSAVVELNAAGNVAFSADSVSEAMVTADPKRLLQICENIVSNSGKYAHGSKVDISLSTWQNGYELSFRDYGKGIPEENLPFITQKFYRGANSENVPGSGLGLFIVSYLCEKMGAELRISNVYENDICKGLKISIYFFS